MSAFVTGLELSILSLVLLFAWFAVAVFASAELAFVVGLGVVGIWVLFFLPSGLIREAAWQNRQKKIMKTAMEQAPEYQPGSALPPPQAGSALAVIDNPSGGAIDIYRDDLPRLLPELEPRPHAGMFKRSLVLPVLGVLMMIGASNDTLMQKLLETRGVVNEQKIAWEKMDLPQPYADKRSELEEAARKALRREGNCASISGGHLAPLTQFTPQAKQAAEIAEGKYVYEFECLPGGRNPVGHMVWISPDEFSRGSIAGLMSSFHPHIQSDAAITSCQSAAGEALHPANLALMTLGLGEVKPEVIPARAPYADYVRLIAVGTLMREGQLVGTINLSCWVDGQGNAKVRFYR